MELRKVTIVFLHNSNPIESLTLEHFVNVSDGFFEIDQTSVIHIVQDHLSYNRKSLKYIFHL